jgi:hypothetical protein
MKILFPKSSILGSVRTLDNKTLDRQRADAYRVLKILRNPNHPSNLLPIVKMWKGCETVLNIYFNMCCQEYVRRGFRNGLSTIRVNIGNLNWPSWFGDDKIHSSHRSYLLYVNPEYYAQYKWEDKPSRDVLYPV